MLRVSKATAARVSAVFRNAGSFPSTASTAVRNGVVVFVSPTFTLNVVGNGIVVVRQGFIQLDNGGVLFVGLDNRPELRMIREIVGRGYDDFVPHLPVVRHRAVEGQRVLALLPIVAELLPIGESDPVGT